MENVENNELDDIARVIETTEDGGSWEIFPIGIRLPGGVETIITVNRNTTVSQINHRLDAAFGFRMYYIGVIVNGEILPAPPHSTMGQLGDDGAEFIVDVGEEVWDDGLFLENRAE